MRLGPVVEKRRDQLLVTMIALNVEKMAAIQDQRPPLPRGTDQGRGFEARQPFPQRRTTGLICLIVIRSDGPAGQPGQIDTGVPFFGRTAGQGRRQKHGGIVAPFQTHQR